MERLLNQGELLVLGENLKGLEIICRSGSCWVTQARDSRDFILRRQSQFEVQSKGQVVVYATSSCRLQLIPGKKPARNCAPLAALKSSLHWCRLPAAWLNQKTVPRPGSAVRSVGKNR